MSSTNTSPTRGPGADDDVEDRFLDLACRTDYAARTVGAGAACRSCGVRCPILLIARRGGPQCYRCAAVHRGFGPTEDHHIGGRPSPFRPVPIDANLHRLVSIAQDLFWRGRFEPGSAEAVAIDITVLFAMSVLARKEIGR